ncbi:hypothetical protein COZ22_02765 [bacterium (Candidatus Howlettbacteria) CG_4_10_14_3_um_filter_37_10]|nr:MAG: hypothetical protein COX25_03440 [bacterium (Candidatus Howlettbacteria) CG23_combo_of_CG06-09_8_20_14_all_37_9]PIX99337.1 MAG: hypothetical protein COZ22_02765 [bacterium (Candidatus Howlettbacteria) CG_4_10_14_3_um_filter_37_10]
MPYRKTVFVENGIYHVINRGVNRSPIFKGQRDYERFLDVAAFVRCNPSIRFSHYNRMSFKDKEEFLEKLNKNEPLVDILSFGLMPNHFHLLLKQLKEGGAQIFMRNLQNSYGKYFNVKYDRVGTVFQSVFKAVPIETDEQLVHVSRYIHLNPVSSNIIRINELSKYEWTSFGYYIGQKQNKFINTTDVLGHFKTKDQYKEFVFDQADYQKELEKIKHLVDE